MDARRSVNGAVAGAAAAALWAWQQPLDRRLLRSRFDDVELLGKFVTRGRAWPVIGFVWHLQNGALFGALYAQVRERLPGPAPVRGLTAAMTEHLASWPLTALTDRFHPARRELPVLMSDPRAFAQATWRHALFGVALGVLEERLNPAPRQEALPVPASSNGQGDFVRAVAPAGQS